MGSARLRRRRDVLGELRVDPIPSFGQNHEVRGAAVHCKHDEVPVVHRRDAIERRSVKELQGVPTHDARENESRLGLRQQQCPAKPRLTLARGPMLIKLVSVVVFVSSYDVILDT